MGLIFARCQYQHPAAMNGEAEVPSHAAAFDVNPVSMGRTELVLKSCLPRISISGHQNWESQDNPPKRAASLPAISAVRFTTSEQQNRPMCSPL